VIWQTRLHGILRDNFGCEEFQLLASEEKTGDETTADVVAGLMIHDYPTPLGAWRAKSARYAKVKSALSAADELVGLTPFEFRAKYGCDCHLKRGEGTLGKAPQTAIGGMVVKV
jgi:endoribonuclease Dicer